jgi:hypothetical protein
MSSSIPATKSRTRNQPPTNVLSAALFYVETFTAIAGPADTWLGIWRRQTMTIEPGANTERAELLRLFETVELHNPDEIPEFNFGNRAFDLGHEAVAEAGIAESELPARCIGDPYFMAGHAVGMAERNHAAVLRAVIPHHRNADALIDDLGGLESDTLAALAAALQVRP